VLERRAAEFPFIPKVEEFDDVKGRLPLLGWIHLILYLAAIHIEGHFVIATGG
jgi:hypothetical protein